LAIRHKNNAAFVEHATKKKKEVILGNSSTHLFEAKLNFEKAEMTEKGDLKME